MQSLGWRGWVDLFPGQICEKDVFLGLGIFFCIVLHLVVTERLGAFSAMQDK